ncbi:MAG: RNA polymerase sigma factor [Fulvivirga sp.]|nr:RNA polymerase sigma factor [Fulvivirga sp.]
MLKVKAGQTQQLALLFERYKKLLFTFFYHGNQDAQLSEDLVQNTFMRILKYRSSFKGEGAFKVWMFHIARNVRHDHFRKQKRFNNEDLDSWSDKIGDQEPNREIEITQTEEMKMLQIALQRLDEDKREIITLSKLQGMKYKEIAQLLSCTEGAVKVKVFRAFNELKEKYNHLASNV